MNEYNRAMANAYNKAMAAAGRLEEATKGRVVAPKVIKTQYNKAMGNLYDALKMGEQKANITRIVKNTAKKNLDTLYKGAETNIAKALQSSGVKGAVGQAMRKVQLPKSALGKAGIAGTIGYGGYRMLKPDETLYNRGIGALQALSGVASMVPIPLVKGAGMVGTFGTPFLYRDEDNKTQQQLPQQEVPTVGLGAVPQEQPQQLEDIDPMITKAYNTSQLPQAQPRMDDVGRMIRQYEANNNLQPEQVVGQQPIQQEVVAEQPQQSGSLQDVLALYQAQLGANQPYLEALQNYLNNYDDIMNQSRRQQRYWAGAAGFTGNDAYRDLAKSYSPEQVEANRVQLIKALAEAKQGNIGELNKLVGNAKTAMSMGLPAEAGLASKDMLNALVNLQRSRDLLEGKRYTADVGYEGKRYGADANLYGRQYASDLALQGRMYQATLDNQIRIAIAQGRMDVARELANEKNRVTLQAAMLNNLPYAMDPSLLYNANMMMGNPLNIQGGGQQTSTASGVDPRAINAMFDKYAK